MHVVHIWKIYFIEQNFICSHGKVITLSPSQSPMSFDKSTSSAVQKEAIENRMVQPC